MATTKTNRRTESENTVQKAIENPKELTRDVVDYLTEYARDNPAYAAMACIGVGFILGWKLKPW